MVTFTLRQAQRDDHLKKINGRPELACPGNAKQVRVEGRPFVMKLAIQKLFQRGFTDAVGIAELFGF